MRHAETRPVNLRIAGLFFEESFLVIRNSPQIAANHFVLVVGRRFSLGELFSSRHKKTASFVAVIREQEELASHSAYWFQLASFSYRDLDEAALLYRTIR